jgi:hypothetical protein
MYVMNQHLIDRQYHHVPLTQCEAPASLASLQLQGVPQLLDPAVHHCMEGSAIMKGCLKPYSIPVALLKAVQHC